MSEKSAYVNTTIFFNWLKMHFVPRKPAGKVVLILDDHSSRCNSIEMLEFAQSEGILLICLPSHTTHYLQPLDRAVFKSVKKNFFDAASKWLKNHPDRKLKRLQFGELLNETWNKSATPTNAISGFRATGIYPFNPDAIPDYAFVTASDSSFDPNMSTSLMRSISSLFQDAVRSESNNIKSNTTNSKLIHDIQNSYIQNTDSQFPILDQNVQPVIVSPAKILNEVSPIPTITKNSTLKKNVQMFKIFC